MGRVVLIRRRRPGYVGPLHGIQLVIVELTLFAALAAAAYGVLAGTGVAIAALAILVVVLARWRGRWLIERRLMVWRYRRRRRLAQTVPASTAMGVLHRLAPDLRVENVPVAGRHQVGVAQDDAGWFAVATVPGAVLATDRPEVPLDLLATSIAEADQAGAVVQLVVQATPALVPVTPSPAEQSYRDLCGQVGTDPVPADRTVSIVVRIDARTLAEALGDHNADVRSAPLVVASLLRRLVTSLRQGGIEASMLDADGLVAAVAGSCDPPAAGDPQGAAYRERWTTWQAGRLAHRTFWINKWPAPARAQALYDALFAAPSTMTTLAITLDPDPRSGLVDLTALVRVTAPSTELGRAGRSLVRAARAANADLFPLDGEQAPATYATAPTGGGAR